MSWSPRLSIAATGSAQRRSAARAASDVPTTTNPTVVAIWRARGEGGRRLNSSSVKKTSRPPSRIGTGRKLSRPEVHADDRHQPQVLIQSLLGRDAGGVADRDRAAQHPSAARARARSHRSRTPSSAMISPVCLNEWPTAYQNRLVIGTGTSVFQAGRLSAPNTGRCSSWRFTSSRDRISGPEARLVALARRRDPARCESPCRGGCSTWSAQDVPVRQRRTVDREDLIAAPEADPVGRAAGLDREHERLGGLDAGLVAPPPGGVEHGDRDDHRRPRLLDLDVRERHRGVAAAHVVKAQRRRPGALDRPARTRSTSRPERR